MNCNCALVGVGAEEVSAVGRGTETEDEDGAVVGRLSATGRIVGRITGEPVSLAVGS